MLLTFTPNTGIQWLECLVQDPRYYYCGIEAAQSAEQDPYTYLIGYAHTILGSTVRNLI
jgi:hypothetical protein